MKKLTFALGVMALGLVASAQAHAEYAIVKFKSGYCRIYHRFATAGRNIRPFCARPSPLLSPADFAGCPT
jgi:hypothetical protein